MPTAGSIYNGCCSEKKKIRDHALEYKGGKCVFCGYCRCQAALDFHHLYAKKKEFGLSRNVITRSWEKTKQELDKCILVCSNCHREIHAGILQPSVEILKSKLG